MFKNEAGGNIMKKFSRLRAKTYAYILVDDLKKKKAKGTKKCIIKGIQKFRHFYDSVF